MTFLELAEKVLEEKQIPMKSNEIWKFAIEKGYDKILGSLGKTPADTLGARLYTYVRDNPNAILTSTDSRPKKFFLKTFENVEKRVEEAEQNEIKEIEKETKQLQKLEKTAYLEKELHAVLAYYAYYYLRTYTKTINHSASTKKEYGEWIHPDMVGCHFSIEDWQSELTEFSNTTGNPAFKLYSFELKRKITFANLREVFFQTVSNSSWANESYLVAAEIDSDDEFNNELKRLSTSFGIGIIKLDITNPDNSEILLPAQTRKNLDWEMMDKLTRMNKDFKEFLKRINNDIKSKEIRKEWYDKITDKEILIDNF